MLQLHWKKVCSLMLVAAMGAASSLALSPLTPALAQVRGLPDFTELVEQVGPSVVNIRTSEKVSSRGAGDNGMDEQMQEFFRRFGIPMPDGARPHGQRPQPQPEDQPRGVGSGFILTSDGFIMTNAHVVDSADEVIVTLTDKREFKARIVGADKRSDVAVVKIEATGLPAVKLGDVSRLKVGEWVMAIGSPFGLENSVTAGIVSAKQRDTGELLPLIQTDVAINPGNSGGPLINMRGEVVGINSQIYSRTGGFQGLSFAIPIDVAQRVAQQILRTGQVHHAKLGVGVQELDQTLAQAFKLQRPQGALISDVDPKSAAQRAGVLIGDVVLAVNGRAIDVSGDLSSAMGQAQPGDAVELAIWRDGAHRTVHARLDDATPPAPSAAVLAPKGPLGLALRPLQADEKRESGVSAGLLVEAVGGAAERAGVLAGDLLLAIDASPMGSLAQANAAQAKAGKSVALLIQRDGTKFYLPLRLP